MLHSVAGEGRHDLWLQCLMGELTQESRRYSAFDVVTFLLKK